MGMINHLFLVLAFTPLVGCVNTATSSAAPGVDLSTLKQMYVKQNPEDKRGVGMLVVDKLKTKGVTASIGTGEPQEKVDALVSYKDIWAWDLTSYMIDLSVLVKDPKTEQVLASGNSRHGSLTRLSATEMVSEVVDNIYVAQSTPVITGSNVLSLSSSNPQNNIRKLQNLKSLRDQGLISKSEYELKKQSILNEM